jgi:hypothetical protein
VHKGVYIFRNHLVLDRAAGHNGWILINVHRMSNTQKKVPLHYARTKNSIQIDGDPSDVKTLILLDLIFNKVWLVLLVIIMLFVLPKASFIPLLWKFIKDKLMMISLLFLEELLIFSG